MEAIRNHPGARRALIIWGALVYSMLMYIVVGYLLVKDESISESFIHDPRSRMLILIALVIIALGFGLSQRIISYNRHYIPTLPIEKRPGQAISAFMVPFLIRMAVLESLGLMGLIMTMNTGDILAVAILCGITILGQLLLFPSANRIAEWSGLSAH
ncbi:MAG: hypothetical protein KF767_02755 [Bdellovibrionaceae bacterium]|nr:hypothetical protein [Pseudobdellovibrionaceae bacterium]